MNYSPISLSGELIVLVMKQNQVQYCTHSSVSKRCNKWCDHHHKALHYPFAWVCPELEFGAPGLFSFRISIILPPVMFSVSESLSSTWALQSLAKLTSIVKRYYRRANACNHLRFPTLLQTRTWIQFSDLHRLIFDRHGNHWALSTKAPECVTVLLKIWSEKPKYVYVTYSILNIKSRCL